MWRFSGKADDIYSKLSICIQSFEGKVRWTMYKVMKNYTIEPLVVYQIRQTEGSENLETVLKEKYSDLCSKAIDDIPALCRKIECEFEVENAKPLAPKTH